MTTRMRIAVSVGVGMKSAGGGVGGGVDARRAVVGERVRMCELSVHHDTGTQQVGPVMVGRPGGPDAQL